MKKNLISIFSTIFFINFIFSQDVINKKSGESIKVKIIEENDTEILYKKFENQNGPIYSIPKIDIVSYNRENVAILKSEDVEYVKPTVAVQISPDSINNNLLNSLNITDPYKQGISDASLNYRKHVGASVGTFCTTVLFVPVGLVTAIDCSSTKPKEINLDFPRSDLMKIDDYKRGYTQKAKKIKQGKVWGGFGIGFGVLIVLSLALGS
jgi:hypothetical protein